MICKNCGKQIKDGVSFCPHCGNSTDKEEENKSVCRTNVKGKLFAISSLCVVLILILLLTLLKGGNVPFVSGDKKIINEFVKCLDKEEYDEAYKLLYFTTEDKVNLSSGGFKAFAEEYLSECEVIKNADKKYTLKTDSKEFNISVNEDFKKILGDDFLMQYKIKYTSYMTSSQNSFKGKPEKTDNGMMVYTINCFKSSDPIVVDYDMLIGEEVGLSAQARAIIEVDDNYALSKISRVGDRLDGKNTDSTLAYIKDGVLILDKYGVTQPYAEKIARTFSALMTDMFGYAQDNASYETFYKDYSAHVCDTDLLKATYQEILKIQPNLAQFDYIDCTATSWTYPKYFSYSDNSYIMEVTVRLDGYKNGKMSSKGDELIWYVMYQPGKEKLRVYNFDTSKEKLLSNSPIIDADTKLLNEYKDYITGISLYDPDVDKEMVLSETPFFVKDGEVYVRFTLNSEEIVVRANELKPVTNGDGVYFYNDMTFYDVSKDDYLTAITEADDTIKSIKELLNSSMIYDNVKWVYEPSSVSRFFSEDTDVKFTIDQITYKIPENYSGDFNIVVNGTLSARDIENTFSGNIAIGENNIIVISNLHVSDMGFDKYIYIKHEYACYSSVGLNTRAEDWNSNIRLCDWLVDKIGEVDSTSTKQASSQNNGQDQDYILPDCDSRYYSQEELEALSAEQLKLARNEIYARHGYIFQTGNTKNYFDSKTWYRGTVTEVTDDMLNEYEIANRDLIILIEKK